MKISIKPVTKTLDTLVIQSVSVLLDNSAYVTAVLYGSDISMSKSFTMDSNTYSQWGADDEFVVNWVMSQWGLERA